MTVSVGLLGASGQARAATPSVFDGLANAYGVQITLANGGIPVVPSVEGSGPVAGGHLSSLGISDGFASFPYPGEVGAGLPGLAGALVGVPVPAYPLIAQSSAGNDPQTVSFGGIDLTSSSSLSEVDARAVVGQAASGNVSAARVQTQTDGSLESVGESSLNALGIGPVLTLSGVHSLAKVVADPGDGRITRTTDLSIGHFSAPGLSITIPSSSPGVPSLPVGGLPALPTLPTLPVPLAGETVPAPDLGFVDGSFTITLPTPGGKAMTYALPAATAVSALKSIGVTASYQAAQNSDTGVVAPGLALTYIANLPANQSGIEGPTPVTYQLGLTSATADLHPIQIPLDTTSSLPIGTGLTGGVTSTGGNVTSTSPLSTGSSLPSGGVTSTTGLTPQVAAATGTPGTPDTVLASVRTPIGDVSLLYLVVVGVAIVGLATATGIRLLGVRSLWSS